MVFLTKRLLFLALLLVCGVSIASEKEFINPSLGTLSDLEWQDYDYISLCYHDVRDDVVGELDADAGAVSTRHLAEHFEWLRNNGYSVISIDDIERARSGSKALPPKAVLLTFDDGYKSFYSHIYPLLKTYDFPAVFAVVSSWLEVPNSQKVPYGDQLKPRQDFLTWKQVREMSDSGLIEIASHSHDLHKGLIANPQQNTQAAALTREFKNGEYESDRSYVKRLSRDFSKSSALIEKHVGRAPRTMVWPYGRYSEEVWQIAKQHGFRHSLVLKDARNKLHAGEHIQRYLIDSNPDIARFKAIFEPPLTQQSLRAVHVDLDYIYDPDPKVTEDNVGRLVERIYRMGPNAVFLQAFADPDGDGNAGSLYFKNRHLPVRDDLFNRVAWQLETRAHVKVFAWMPVLAFDLGDEVYQKLGVKEWKGGRVVASEANYRRLSPFNKQAKKIIVEIYEDLGKYASFGGVLFHDDAYLSDFEDVSPDAMAYYQNMGLPSTIDELRSSSAQRKAWAKVKEKAINDFTKELEQVLLRYETSLATARNIYASPIINTDAQEWFAQSLESFAEYYDYVAIMAMPYMENSDKPDQWLANLQTVLDNSRVDKSRIVIELQAIDWRNQKQIPSELLVKQMQEFLRGDYLNFAYYPDDLHKNHPDLQIIRQSMSLDDFPYRKK